MNRICSISPLVHYHQDLHTKSKRSSLHCQQPLRWIFILLVLAQIINTIACHDIVLDTESKHQQNSEYGIYDKRTAYTNGNLNGQPEEIFNAGETAETNYDEYPMVVPKRAALLLDRLMVALHHAMEKEHGHQRFSMYANKNTNTMEEDNETDRQNSDDSATPLYQMYSDDDPNVNLDYDFRDLNSINRATGESLMAKSFQRRGNMGANGVALLSAGNAVTADEAGIMNSANGVGNGGGGRGGGGRLYWRCYFNAVSCF